MRLTTAVLCLAGLMYLGFGVAFLIAPGPLADLVHLSVEHPVARTEIRAFYGGLEVGFGIFLLLCLWVRGAARTGALALALVAGCTVLGRVVGLAVDHSAGSTMLAILAVEGAVAILGTIVYIVCGKEPRK